MSTDSPRSGRVKLQSNAVVAKLVYSLWSMSPVPPPADYATPKGHIMIDLSGLMTLKTEPKPQRCPNRSLSFPEQSSV